MIEWPHGAFPLQVSSYSVTKQKSVRSYADYGGMPRQVLNRSLDTINIAAFFALDDCDGASWKDFFYNALNNGVEQVLITVDIGAGLEQLPAVIIPETIQQTRTVMGWDIQLTFAAQYQGSTMGIEDAVLPLELLPSYPYSFTYGRSNIADIDNSGVILVSRDLKYESVPFSLKFENINRHKLNLWTEFYRQAIDRGAFAFIMPLDTGSGIQPHNVVIQNGQISITTESAISWTVSFTAIAERIDTEGEFCGLLWELADCYGGTANLVGVVNTLDELINDSMPQFIDRVDYEKEYCGSYAIWICYGSSQAFKDMTCSLDNLINTRMPIFIPSGDY